MLDTDRHVRERDRDDAERVPTRDRAAAGERAHTSEGADLDADRRTAGALLAAASAPGGDRERAGSLGGVMPDAGRMNPGGLLALQRTAGNSAVSSFLNAGVEAAPHDGGSQVRDVVGQAGSPLEPRVQADMEGRLGHDFSDVRVHTGPAASDSADSIGARAYTAGSNVVFGAGEYAPGTSAGRQVLAHELTHVAQQRSGPVEGTPVGGGIALSHPSDSFERQADQAAESAAAPPAGAERAAGAPATVQRLAKPGTRSSAGRHPLMVQALYLDGTTDWVGATTKRKFLMKVTRSKALKAIDDQLKKWLRIRTQTPSLDDQSTVLGDLTKAITTWGLAGEGDALTAKVKALGDEVALESTRVENEKAEQKRIADEEKARKKEERRKKREAREQKKAEAAKQKAQDDLDKTLKTWAEIEALPLKDLATYVTTTPNWHARSTLTDPQREIARKLEPLGASAAAQNFTVASIEALGAGTDLDAALTDLDSYLAGVERNEPFSLEKAANAAEAVKFGKALTKLKASFPAWVLRSALKDRVFRILVQFNLVDDVCTYYTTSTPQPIFQAENESDFLSYAQMRVNDHKDPLTYHSGPLRDKIRNFHRFEPAALDQLIANYADTSRAKPLTMIVHASIDHNGAFHRDPLLTQVITNTHINALMIEGGETLASYTAQITPLADTYGINKKIDQVMFAGHGNSRLMQMAGSVQEGTGKRSGRLVEQDDAIDLDNNSDETNKLFDEVLKNMDPKVVATVSGSTPVKQQNRRILFNACLTNSNAVSIGLSKGKSAAKKEILDYIKANGSLATYLQQRAESQGKDITSTGANASIGQVNLIQPSTGKLDLVSTEDPTVTSPKLVYAEQGIEPSGVLRAALEAWAADEKKALAAMGRRAARKSDKWNDAIIESIYDMVISQKNNKVIASILQAYESAASVLYEMTHDEHCRVKELAFLNRLPEWMVEPVLTRLATTPTWTAKKQIRVVIAQVRLLRTASDGPLQQNLLTELGTGWDAKTVTDYLDVPELKTAGSLTGLLATPPTDAKVVLALVGVLDHGNQADCKAFLAGLLQPALPEIPALDKVEPVPEVPSGKGARAVIPEVPAVPGRPQAAEIPGIRPEVAEVADLPKLDALPEVKGKKTDAPGRAARPGRAAVNKVPAVDPYFLPALKVKDLAGGRKTEAQISTLVRT